MVLATFYKDRDKDKQPVLDSELFFFHENQKDFRNFATFAYED
jgi:hypothetical protein